ncbi:MAG: hypothetical protein NUV91_07040 [Candidatus Omnitrophica bacterium]|nr:hypothetical protein [Candidatus Omnitrophota bacterium]
MKYFIAFFLSILLVFPFGAHAQGQSSQAPELPSEVLDLREEQKSLLENYQQKKKDIDARLQEEVERETKTNEERQAQEKNIRLIQKDLRALKVSFQEELRVLRDREAKLLGAPSQKLGNGLFQKPIITIYQPPVPATPKVSPTKEKASQGSQQIQTIKQHLQQLNQEIQQLEKLLKELESSGSQ